MTATRRRKTKAPAVTPLPEATPASQGFSPERLARLDAAMAKAVADEEVGGMLTLLARNGKVVAFGCYGDAAPGRPRPRLPDVEYPSSRAWATSAMPGPSSLPMTWRPRRPLRSTMRSSISPPGV